MHDAAYQDVNPELVEYLIEAGGDPNKPNRFGETAVYEAAYRAKPELMAILLRAGGDPNIYTVEFYDDLALSLGRLTHAYPTDGSKHPVDRCY